MDDFVPKQPMKTAKAGARTTRPSAVSAPAPQLSKTKPTGKKPAPTPKAVPVIPFVNAAPALSPPVPDAPVAIDASAVVPAAVATAPTVEAAAPAAVITPSAAKEAIMETIENVTAKTQTAFNEATERAKGAVEKSQKMFEDANEFGKGNVEALVESSKIAARGLETLSQEAAAFAKKSFEEATAAAKTLSSVKSPTEFMKLQSDYVRSAFDAMVKQASHNTEAMLKLAGDVAQPLSNRVALAAEKMKVAA